MPEHSERHPDVTPWVVVALHRPILSAAVLEWKDHSPGGKLSAALEPLLMAHKVRGVRVRAYGRTYAHCVHGRTHTVFTVFVRARVLE